MIRIRVTLMLVTCLTGIWLPIMWAFEFNVEAAGLTTIRVSIIRHHFL